MSKVAGLIRVVLEVRMLLKKRKAFSDERFGMGTHLLFAVEGSLWRNVEAGAGCWNTGASAGCTCSRLHASTITSEHGSHESASERTHAGLCTPGRAINYVKTHAHM